MIKKGGYIYIITNQHNTTLYIGVTSSLKKRIYEHREKLDYTSFSARYNLNKLVYYEFFQTIEEAIAREKQLKGGSRKKKEAHINADNPEWKDLWEDIQEFWD
ncbi:GIY-YIG nuclease family protein [soil metagenome]